MTATLALVGAGVGLFAATNVDDLVLLVGFFADRQLPARKVVAGQFLGIAALTVVSRIAALAAFALPRAWMGLLGFVPIAIGVVKLQSLLRSKRGSDDATAAASERSPIQQWLRSPVLAVAAVTVANGGDNFAAYVPVFSLIDTRQFGVIALTFAAMTGLWCGAGYAVASNPIAGYAVRRVGHRVLPFVLIVIGVLILLRAGTVSLLAH